MKIVVVGGSGLIGGKVVARLKDRGHDAVPAAPSTGVNTLTGAGVAEALDGASVVVDVSNAPSWEPKAALDFFITSTRNVLAAEAAAGVEHHVVLSIVGADRLPESGYMRAKAAQEKLIMESTVPYSVVRATQFFEFLPMITDSATDGKTVHLPPVSFQPIAADDVAEAVVEVAVGPPVNGRIDVAGPERFRFDELVRSVLADDQDPREVTTDPAAGYFGTLLEETSLVPVGTPARTGAVTVAEWRSGQASSS